MSRLVTEMTRHDAKLKIHILPCHALSVRLENVVVFQAATKLRGSFFSGVPDLKKSWPKCDDLG